MDFPDDFFDDAACSAYRERPSVVNGVFDEKKTEAHHLAKKTKKTESNQQTKTPKTPKQPKQGNATLVMEQQGVCKEIIHRLLHHEQARVAAFSVQGYRNKILYGLDKCELSELACDSVNEVCRSVFHWIQNASSMPRDFWVEVLVKVTMKGCFMLRLSIRGDETTTIPTWLQGERVNFINFLLSRHPTIETISYQVCDSSKKPSKHCPYFVAYGPGYITEYTPNGVGFRLSPDAFCEINHLMEREVFNTMLKWATDEACSYYQQPMTAALVRDQKKKPLLVTIGRNVHSFAFGFMGVPDCPFEKCIAITHCHLVHSDTCATMSWHPQSQVEAKLIPREEQGEFIMTGLPDNQPIIMLVTSGRHGLYQPVRNAFKLKRSIGCIIYDSCNEKSMTRDISELITGPSPMQMVALKSFDFFSGTEFLASTTMLKRVPPTLLLPVGPAGAGKSSFVRKLQSMLPGGFLRSVERDVVFSAAKASGLSLSATRTLVHETILSELRKGTNTTTTNPSKNLVADCSWQPAWARSSSAFSASPTISIQLNETPAIHEAVELLKGNLPDNYEISPVMNDAKTTASADAPPEQHLDTNFLPGEEESPPPPILAIDTTNGNVDARYLYRKEFGKTPVLFVEFRVFGNPDHIVEVLHKRTELRGAVNGEHHPSFPTQQAQQLEKHKKILEGIVFPSENITEIEDPNCHILTIDVEQKEEYSRVLRKLCIHFIAPCAADLDLDLDLGELL